MIKTRIRDLVDRMPDRKLSELEMWALKFCLLDLLHEVDRALDYGRPGRAIDQMLGTTPKVVPINARREAAE